jgi:anti-anti-sigma regulatory factor
MVEMMRHSGAVTDVRRLGPHDHVCWGFDDFAEFRAAALAFLQAGIGLGQRVCYVGELSDGVYEALTGARPGAVRLLSVAAHYANGQDPREQVEAHAAATKNALAAGFTGLRVATDVTPLIRRSAHLDAFARYEHQADHLMTTRPFSAMCAYNRTILGSDVLTQLSVMHPLTTERAPYFRLHASSVPGCAAAISGELDLSNADLLDLALKRAELRPTDGELVLDAANLTFIDRRRLAALADHARLLDATLVLRSDRSVLHRLTQLLDWDNVRIDAAS